MHEGVAQLTNDRYLWSWNIDGTETRETLDMVFLRVAKKVASAWLQVKPEDYTTVVEKAHEFFDMMHAGLFMPSSPQLFNAMRGFGNGKKHYDIIYKDIDKMTSSEWNIINEFKNPKAAYGSCYSVGRIGDSIEEIYDALKEQAMIFKAAGGYGVSFSDLRSKGEHIATTKGQSCGAVEFMELFNLNTKKIALSGQLKRGANMFSLSVSHPDIEEFIDKKMELINDEEEKMIRSKYLEHANLSVEVTDEFIDAVKNDLDWNLIDPHSKEIKKTLKARTLYRHIINNALKSGEPGILMIDNINRYNPIRDIEPITSVNPCVTGDTLVPTTKGLIRANELKEGMLTWNPVKMQMDVITSVHNNGIKDIYEVILENGLTLRATPEHKLKVTGPNFKGILLPVSDLELGQKVHTIMYVEADGDELDFKQFTGLNPATECLFEVVSIRPAGREIVYDITVPDNYMWVTNGFISLDCSEYNGLDKTVCNLGSINIYNMIDYETKLIDIELMKQTILSAVYYLNLALLANDYPTDELTRRSLEFRPIGLGFMGLGSAFIRLGYKYGAADSQKFTTNFMDHFMYYTIMGSNNFYKDSGVLFKHYEESDYVKGNFFFTNTKFAKEIKILLKDGITNSRLAAIAPNGSIPKIVAGTISSKASTLSGGVEPLFDLAYTRRVNPDTDKEYTIDEVDLGVYDTFRDLGYSDEDISNLLKDSDKLKEVFKEERWTTAKNLSVDEHLSILKIVTDAIDMQASKTVNLPATYTEDMLYDFYLKAYDMGLKGLTVFVDGSRSGILESKKKDKKPEFFVDLNFNKQGKILPKDRPVVIPSLKKTIKFKENGNEEVSIVNIEVGFDNDNNPFEVFIRSTTSTKGYTELFNAIGRLVSLSLRSNADIESILKQIKKIKNWKNEYSIIAKVIAESIGELVSIGKLKSKKKREDTINEINKHKLVSTPKGYMIDPNTGEAYCPVCYSKEGEGLNFSSGCITCNNCGWSGCDG
ncbi:MAG: ribonucleotide reductase N-terminal alpha domain-containing protein [Clostridia bacterium]|jgi:ribonucleoside-diphosphate reductase alpha chain